MDVITAAPAPPTRRRSVGTGYYHVMVRVAWQHAAESVRSVSRCTLFSPSPTLPPVLSNVFFPLQGVVTYMSHVEAFATVIKIESSDQSTF